MERPASIHGTVYARSVFRYEARETPETICVEVKTTTGKLRPEQRGWLDALARCEGVEARLWRPGDWPEITEVLRRFSKGEKRA